MVKNIPIPQKPAPPNPLANESKSSVPQAPPEKPQPKPQAKAPDPVKAIEIPDKVKPAPAKAKASAEPPRKAQQKPQQTPAFRMPTEYKPNQVNSRTAPALSNPMFGMQGSGGIDIGPASVLGNRFGAYVSLMRDRIAQNWNKSDVRAGASDKVAISFTIARNGGVSNVQVSKPSGNYLLDNSAKRAVVDSNPLPPLPQQFQKNEATVELWFQLKQ